ncbi:hypothetical protein ACIQXW_23395 [Lysinibacillus sp. NPDC097162]|uniref:hypothetical protein n=1 Tax=Lysinibacillus sp. NPDC097162 TaxID=3364140 RepID=UPI00380DD7F9
MNTITYAKERNYDLLSKFTDISDFNNNFEQAMIDVKSEFTKSEYIALNKLRKFAANVVGVAWCKIQKAVASTHASEMVGVSRSTFDRMLRKARKLNLITVINTQKANNYQAHNIFVFNRVDELKLPNEINEIVSDSHTIDVSTASKLTEPEAINLSELPLQKQVKDNKKTLISDSINIEDQRDYIEKYATNEYQIATFKLIESMPMSAEIKAKAHVIALRIGSDATITDFIRAKSVLLNMSVASAGGTAFDNVVGAFTSAYNSASNRPKAVDKPAIVEAKNERKIPFYNWLKERSHASGRAVYNWLTGE